MSNYIEITEVQTDAGSPIDEDLMRGTTGSDPDGGIRGNLRNLDARVTVVEGGGGGGGGAAGIQVEERFTELRKKFGDGVVDSSSECVCESFQTEVSPTLNYRLMRDVAASDTALYVAPNPNYIDAGNPDFDYTSFTWSALAGTDAASVAADNTNNLIGTDAPSWSKSGGTAVNSIINRNIGTGKYFGGHRTWLAFARIDTTTNLTNFLIRLSVDTTVGTNYSEWRVSAQQLGAGFINSATGIGYNILLFDLHQTADATGGTPFDITTDIANSVGFGTIVSSSGQTHAVTVDSLFPVPDSGEGLAEVHPEYDRYTQPGKTWFFVDSSNIEIQTFDISGASGNTSVIGQCDVVAGFTNAFTGGSSTTIRRNTLKTDDGRAEFDEDDSELTSGASENTQYIISETTLPETASSSNFDFSVDYHTPLTFYVKDKPTSTTFTANSEVDFSGELPSGAVLRLYNTRWERDRGHYKEVQDVTLTANTSFSSSVLTFTASSGDVTAITVGDLVKKTKEVNVVTSVVAITANDATALRSKTFLTPDEQPLEDIGFKEPADLEADFFLGGATSPIARKNRAVNGATPDLSLVGTGPSAITVPFAHGRFAASGFSSVNHYSIAAADSTAFDSDTSAAGAISGFGWVRADQSITTNQALWSRWNGSAGWVVYVTSAGLLRMAVNGVGFNGPAFPLDGKYHFVGFSHDDTAATAQVILDDTFTSSALSVSTVSTLFRVGYNPSLAAVDKMTISSLSIVSGRVMSDGEFTKFYNQGAFAPIGSTVGAMKQRYNVTAQSGDRVVMMTELDREANTHYSFINKTNGVKLS